MTGDVHKLGEVLRTAREGKGVDLARVERDTKIRERYLSALERGEYRELPGAVYTKGFLRNYGAYLGLDTEYLIDLYRIESAAAAGQRPARPAAPPRPLGARRTRAFVVTPGAVVAAILTISSAASSPTSGFEIVNFARTPELRITSPPGDVNGHTELEITVHRRDRAERDRRGQQPAREPDGGRRCGGQLRGHRSAAAGVERHAARRERPGDGPQLGGRAAHDPRRHRRCRQPIRRSGGADARRAGGERDRSRHGAGRGHRGAERRGHRDGDARAAAHGRTSPSPMRPASQCRSSLPIPLRRIR